jgi:hypothetical protein
MKNTLLIRLFFVTLMLCLCSSALLADGKLPIVQPVQPEYVPSATLVFEPLSPELIPPTQSDNQPNIATAETVTDQKEKNDSATRTVAINSVVNRNGSVQVILPQPQKRNENSYIPIKLFLSGEMKGIIAWNGKTDENGEEIMILESTEKSNTSKNEAYVGIIPLPGKPISVDRINKNIFNQTKIILDKKIPSLGQVGGIVCEPYCEEVASFTVLVLDAKNIDSFEKEVNSYIQRFYEHKICIYFQPNELKVIKNYCDQGFRYFALDIAPLLTRPVTKQPILFHFKSKFVYYPLAINAIGGTGRGTIDLFVITPSFINLGGAFEQGKEQAKLRLIGNKTIDFSLAELRELEPRLTKMFEPNEENRIKVRNFWIVSEDIGTFTKDFVAFPVVSNEDNPKLPISEEPAIPKPDTPTIPATESPTTPTSETPTIPVSKNSENVEPPQENTSQKKNRQ